MNHRSKNMLAKVQALARSSIAGDPDLVKRFAERVGSLAVNQDILVRRDWKEVPVEELVRLQLRFVEDKHVRINHSGPDCALVPRAAEIVGMALHELATNSAKYGALSVDGGTVSIVLDCPETGEEAHVSWREAGGPEANDPAEEGFGSRLIRSSIEGQLGGRMERRFARSGLEVDLSIPLKAIHS